MTNADYINKRLQYIQELEDALTNNDDAWVNEVWRKIDELDLMRANQAQLDEEQYYDKF